VTEFTREKLAECVSKHTGVPPFEFRKIPTGRFNTGFFVRAGEREYVIRFAPPDDSDFLFYERKMMRQEPGIHSLVLQKTSVPVPRIIAFDESREVIGRDYIIMEKLPGAPLSERPCADFDAVFREVGAALSEVHKITSGKYGYLGEHRPMEPQDSWQEAFTLMWESLLEDVEKTGQYSADDRLFMSGLLKSLAGVFDRNVPASLLHMDIWAENLLVSGGSLSGVLDWDRALWGDPEIEFQVLDYCGISAPSFWEGYGKGRDASPEARVRGVFYFLYELQKYIVIRHGRDQNPGLARGYRDRAEAVARDLERVCKEFFALSHYACEKASCFRPVFSRVTGSFCSPIKSFSQSMPNTNTLRLFVLWK
jgi:aminoglycoside phosphotransferase (APT) family kinase protein